MPKTSVPDNDYCLQLIADMEMMPHIIDHSRIVARVASLMFIHLGPLNPGLVPEVIRAAALLHDITKTRSFTTGERHAETGGQLLKDLGYPRVGDVIRQHVLLDDYPCSGSVTEAEIVNYADKRVLHDTVVPLEQRLGYILDRYGTNQEHSARIRFLWTRTVALEQRLFAGLSITPDQVGLLIGNPVRE